ncbi:MAG: glycosyltransferase family 2 protein [Bacilli bacterium]|nr:glycosyltransferase family 2 protein [Bacilli bacterium]
MKKISIIIPAYNAEKYIKETLESILSQTFHKIEVIVIDDGSKDKTNQLVEKYQKKHPDIIQLYSQKNLGQSSARNKALQYVSGDYIAFVDADDTLKKDCLEKLYSKIEEEKADIVICGYEKFYDFSDEIFYQRMPNDWDVEFDHGFHHIFQYSPCAKLFRTSFIKKYNLKFSEGEQLEDGPYNALANLLATKVVSLNYIGYRYRVYENSTMGNIRKKNNRPKPPYHGVITLIEKFDQFNKDSNKRQVMEYCTTKILAGFVTTMYKTCDRKTRKEICNYCHEIMRKYFKNIRKNPYIKIKKLKKLPLSHRVAVRLFVFFDRINLLYPFSVVITKVL